MAARRKMVNGLTAKQMKDLRAMLDSRHDELQKSIEARRQRHAAIDPDNNIEEMDQATTSQEQAFELRVLDKESKLLREVERALKKFEDETYGLCEGTEEPIGYARLEARPWARYSVAFKEEREREERQMSARLPGR